MFISRGPEELTKIISELKDPVLLLDLPPWWLRQSGFTKNKTISGQITIDGYQKLRVYSYGIYFRNLQMNSFEQTQQPKTSVWTLRLKMDMRLQADLTFHPFERDIWFDPYESKLRYCPRNWTAGSTGFHPLEEEKHLPNPHFLGFKMLVFGGVNGWSGKLHCLTR